MIITHIESHTIVWRRSHPEDTILVSLHVYTLSDTTVYQIRSLHIIRGHDASVFRKELEFAPISRYFGIS